MNFCTNLSKRHSELDVMHMVVVNSSKAEAGAVLFLTDHIALITFSPLRFLPELII